MRSRTMMVLRPGSATKSHVRRDGAGCLRERRIYLRIIKQPLENGNLGGVDDSIWAQVGEVVTRLRIADAARQYRIGDAIIGAAIFNILIEPRFRERHRPRLIQTVDARMLRILAQNQAGPIERAAQDPLFLQLQALVFD